MALRWDITKCADPDALLSEERRDTTDAIIWATMFTGIGTITEANVDEFWARLVIGGYWQGDKPMPPGVLRQYIGLTTNVFPTETRAKWLKRQMGGRLDTAARWSKAHAEDTEPTVVHL